MSGQAALVFSPSPGVYIPLLFRFAAHGSRRDLSSSSSSAQLATCVQDVDGSVWEQILQLGLLPLLHQGEMITVCYI